MIARPPLVDFHSGFDLWWYALLNRDGGPWMDAAMRALSTHAFGVAFGALLGVFLVATQGRSALRPIVALGLAFLVSDLVGSQLLRPLIGRMRPCYALPPGSFRWLVPAANGPSLPSLHASNFFAMALVFTLARRGLAPLAYAIAIAVSVSRIYLGVHWPTDVLAGVVWGTLAGALGWAVSRPLARVPRAPAP